MTVTEDSQTSEGLQRKSLLERYEIPLEHLDFKYIQGCKDVKEIERIVRILRSKEEGYYPELLKCAEDKLVELAPTNRLLRKETPVLSKNTLEPSEWNSIIEDMQDWQDEVGTLEKSLSETVETPDIFDSNRYPEVRKFGKQMAEDKAKSSKKVEDRITSFDYDKWDKYDAEAECVKIDLEEEKNKEEKERKEREEEIRKEQEIALLGEQKIIDEVKKSIVGLAEGERKVLATKEKDLGNEFYRVNDLDKAIRHYTRSIAIFPTPVAYNNRAATYLKQCKYSKALEDTNIVLEMDPNNVKAYYRRALSLQHKNEFHKALDDIRQVLKREPNHVVARHVADQLREHCNQLPRKCKLLMKDDKPNDHPNNMKLVEVTEDEMLRDYKDKNFVEVNDWGLPKIMCNCNGKYTNDPGIRHDHRVRFQHLNDMNESARAQPKIENITEKENKKDVFVMADEENHKGKVKRLNIVELEKLADNVTPRGCYEGGEGSKSEKQKENESLKDICHKNCTDNKDEKKEHEDTKEEQIEQNLDLKENEKIIESYQSENASAVNANEVGITSEIEMNETKSLVDKREGEADVRRQEENKRPKRSASSRTPLPEEMAEDAGPSTLIQIAKKYREKVSQPRSKVTASKTVVEDETESRPPSSLEESAPSYISPFQFWEKWVMLMKNNGTYEEKAQLLRTIRPHLLQAVIGNKLDDVMLGNFLHCLEKHFSIQREGELIVGYLTAIMQLERFSIIYSFLNLKEKRVAQKLMEMLGPKVNHHLIKAYQ